MNVQSTQAENTVSTRQSVMRVLDSLLIVLFFWSVIAVIPARLQGRTSISSLEAETNSELNEFLKMGHGPASQ